MSDRVESVNLKGDCKFESANQKGECPGYLQGNVRETKKGLIVLQEWWGMNEQIKLVAKHLGEMGKLVTLVPDLYRGVITEDYETAGHLMNDLDWPGAVEDIRGAAKYLLSNGCTKVGVTGFCMGGALSLAAAALVKEISASAPFYGIPSAELCDVSEIRIPVQAHFAENDTFKGFSSKEDAGILKQKQSNNAKFELFLYENCGHAFCDSTGPRYNEQARALAFSRTTYFMNKWLS